MRRMRVIPRVNFLPLWVTEVGTMLTKHEDVVFSGKEGGGES